MANIFDKLEPIVKKDGKSAKTQKIVSIEAGPHKFAGPANVEATLAAGLNKDSFFNGSHMISEREGSATPAVIAGTQVPPLTGFKAEISAATITTAGPAPTLSATTPVPANAVIGPVTWTSGTPATATVTPAGVITLKAAGTTTFTATETATGVTSTVDLTVTA